MQVPRAVVDADDQAILDVTSRRKIECSCFAIRYWDPKVAPSLNAWMPCYRIRDTNSVFLYRRSEK